MFSQDRDLQAPPNQICLQSESLKSHSMITLMFTPSAISESVLSTAESQTGVQAAAAGEGTRRHAGGV